MKKLLEYKWIILVFIVLIIAIITVYLLFQKADEKEEKQKQVEANTNEAVVQDVQYEGMDITNINLTIEGDLSVFRAIITNNTNQDKDISEFGILLKDKDGNEVVTLLGYIVGPLKAGESREIISSVDMPLTNDVVASAEYVEYTE